MLVSRAGQPRTRRWVSITQGSEQEGRAKKLPLGKKLFFELFLKSSASQE